MSFFRGLFGSKAASAPVAPSYTGLQIQTSVSALPIPICWGRVKIAINLIWYNNFVATAVSSGGGGGGGKGFGGGSGSSSTTSYVYTASLIMALCEGPIADVVELDKSRSIYTLADLNLSLAVGSNPQSHWSFLTTNYPSQDFAYQQTAFLYSATYTLGSGAQLDNHNAVVDALRAGTGTNGVDADWAHIINDFLTNDQFGVGFSSASIDSTSLFGAGGDASLQTYCKGVGICGSPALVNQETASSVLARWLAICNTAPVWSGGKLKFIPYGDAATVAGTSVSITLTDAVPEVADTNGNRAITVTAAARFVSDAGVIYASTGAALTHTALAPTGVGTYGISPNGTYLFDPTDAGADVQISFVYSVAASYTPNLTPNYNFAEEDLLVEPGADPVRVERSDPYAAYNIVKVEFKDRNNAYNVVPSEARDQNAIEIYGRRIAPTMTAHDICDPTVAAIVAQLMNQRSVNVRNQYHFRLGIEYCLVEPMDLNTISDSVLGLTNRAIRITEIEENEDGGFDITAEEFPNGVASATLYPTQQVNNNPLNRGAAAAAVNAPIIFEPPVAMLDQGATGQLWIAASADDPNWGGCNVYLAIAASGASFVQVGTIYGKANMGLLTAQLPQFVFTNPDTTDTLAVNLSESLGSMPAPTITDSANAVYKLVIQNGTTSPGSNNAVPEIIAYGSTLLTSAYNYNVGTLYRGLFSSNNQTWASGSNVALIDASLWKYDLPSEYLNSALQIKLQSFNVFGAGLQDLSTCAVYSYNPFAGQRGATGSAGKRGTYIHPGQRRNTHAHASRINSAVPIDRGRVSDQVGYMDDKGSVTDSPEAYADHGKATGVSAGKTTWI